jgi:hypothetical protein
MGSKLASRHNRVRSLDMGRSESTAFRKRAIVAKAIEPLESRTHFSVASFNFAGQSAGGPPLTPASVDPNATVPAATYGFSVASAGASNDWGGSGFSVTSTESAAIADSNFASFSITANSGYQESLTTIDAYTIRRSKTGPSTGIWQYSVGGGSFTDIGSAITWGGTTTNAGNPEGSVDLSGISALQNVAPGTNVTLRVVTWGASSTGGTWYFNGNGTNPTTLTFEGSVRPPWLHPP